MKKKLLSMTLAIAMLSSCGAVLAEDKAPTVFVNSSEIMFNDQAPVILGEGTTLVPARGVFEAMDATVTWDGETRMVEVESSDHNTLVRLTIDDNVMRVYDLSGIFGALISGQDFKAPETAITLDVAPQILNDRTMIPLRAISEALNADVKWDGDAYAVNITTTDYTNVTEGKPALSLSSSSTEVKAGENVDIYVDASNIPEGVYVGGVTATVKYNKENFEFVESALVNGDTVIEGALGASNPDFNEDYVKALSITIDAETAAKADGKVMKLTFKSINGGEGSFALSNGYDTEVGFNTSLIIDALDENTSLAQTEYFGKDLVVDSTPLHINGSAK